MLNIKNIKSGSADTLEEIISFLQENPSDGVRLRPEDVHKDAIDSGFALEIRKDNKIVGCSFVYQYPDHTSNSVYGEIGTMRVTANGYGMQSFLAYFHMLQLYLQDFSLMNSTVFAVVTPGTDSEKNLQDRVGMVAWSPPKTLRHSRSEGGVPFTDGKRVLHANTNTLQTASEKLRLWHLQDNTFSTPKEGETISIDMGGFTPNMLDVNLA